jgi:23S rRNA (uracil1939-C5)-methyltransferase
MDSRGAPRRHEKRSARSPRRAAGPERLTVAIAGLAEDGAALAATGPGERPLLIPIGAVPGDEVEVAIEHRTRAARFGRVLRVLAPAPARVEPRCPIVARCGGCPWQAIAYPVQLEAKWAALVRELRARPALREAPVSPVRGLPGEPYGYRTKIQMAVGGRAGALRIGFFRPHTHEIVDAPGCAVQHPEGNRIIAEARAILDRARIAPYDERRHEGVLRYLLLRVDGSGVRAALTLVVRTDRFPGRREVAEALAGIRGVTGVSMNVQPARGNVVLGRRTERLAGRERLLLEVAGMRFLLSPAAFFQTSAAAAEVLVERVRADLPGPYDTVVDLYCGAGLFARALADRARRVIGVEESRAAVEDALASLRLADDRRDAAALEFVAAPARAWVARFSAERGRPVDAVVVDPPRAGLEEDVLEAIAARLRPRRLVYVSCSPETLIRDLELFAARGYRTKAIDPVDMFPHTPHLECVALVEPAR